MAEKIKSLFETKQRNGKRYMICRNSVPDGKYWKGTICNEWSEVGNVTSAVLCTSCTSKLAGAPEVRSGYISKGRPRGWQFMVEFVDADGNVFHKGIEQPKLKGTRAVTKIEPTEGKKKLTKQEKADLKDQILSQIVFLRGQILKSSKKTEIKEHQSKMKKLNRQLNKVNK
jgi:hypothetical protein